MNDQHTWIKAAKARGWSEHLRWLLDTLEPIGPLGAQVLWVVQPVGGLFGWRGAIGQIAEALETPEGIAELRQQLDDLDEGGFDSHG